MTASWSKDGKTLTITSVLEMNRDGQSFQMNSTEIWTLMEDGKVLKIDQTRVTPRGERKSVLQYNKEVKVFVLLGNLIKLSFLCLKGWIFSIPLVL